MRTRSYDFASAHPIEAADIISIVPVTKHSPYTSADVRRDGPKEPSPPAPSVGSFPETSKAALSN